MWPFKKKELPIKPTYQRVAQEFEEAFYVPTPEQIARRAQNFEAALRDDIYRSGKNQWIKGGGSSPWETVAAYVVALEKRVKELESK